MDKADFIKLAPKYYALAIALRFTKYDSPQTRQSIMSEYMIHEEGGTSEDAYCLGACPSNRIFLDEGQAS